MFCLFAFVALIVVVQQLTPAMLRHMAIDGTYSAICQGHPGIDGEVSVSSDRLNLILSDGIMNATIPHSAIYYVKREHPIEGFYRLFILWQSPQGECLTLLSFDTRRDRRMVQALLSYR
jgi:hypothetical protein